MKNTMRTLTVLLCMVALCGCHKDSSHYVIVRGRVVDVDNNPIEGITVSTQYQNNETDYDGYYWISVSMEYASELRFSDESGKFATATLWVDAMKKEVDNYKGNYIGVLSTIVLQNLSI